MLSAAIDLPQKSGLEFLVGLAENDLFD